METENEFIHTFEKGAAPRALLTLHGTGGDEYDLVPLGRTLDPEASILSPRGKINEGGANRFFRRFAEGVFDQEDVQRQTDALAAFVSNAVSRYGLEGQPMVAVGFSNGANMASNLLLKHPELLTEVILLRAQIIFEPDPQPDLTGKRVFIASGKSDPILPAPEALKLAEIYQGSGASVEHLWLDAGHHLTREEIFTAREWLTKA